MDTHNLCLCDSVYQNASATNSDFVIFSGTESLVTSADNFGLLAASALSLAAGPFLRSLYDSLCPPVYPYPHTLLSVLLFTLALDLHTLDSRTLPNIYQLIVNVMSVLIMNNLIRNIRDHFRSINKNFIKQLRLSTRQTLFISSYPNFSK